MKRKGMNFLIEWLHSDDRLPLIIRGARQVGKTWLVKQLAVVEQRTLIDMNFEFDRSLVSLFSSNDPKKIIQNIERAFTTKIDPSTCILFVDEIQVKPEIIEKLRWFAERMPELPVIAAGSLLEFVLGTEKLSMPVGRIEYMYLEPLSFEEFLNAKNEKGLLDVIYSFSWNDEIPDHLHDRLHSAFQEYILVGGMPAAVNKWVHGASLSSVAKVQQNLMQTYRDDFPKYAPKIDPDVLDQVLIQVVKNLGKKFVYTRVSRSVPSLIVKKSLNLLCKARFCHKILRSDARGVPVSAQADEKFFKTIFLDVGLCSALLKLSLEDINEVGELEFVNSGGIAEQIVGQMLRTIEPFSVEPELYYWLRFRTGVSAEIDYVIQHRTKIIPIEVKAGKAGTLRSLHSYVAAMKTSLAMRVYSGKPYKQQVSLLSHSAERIEYELRSIPFYLMSQAHRLLDS